MTKWFSGPLVVAAALMAGCGQDPPPQPSPPKAAPVAISFEQTQQPWDAPPVYQNGEQAGLNAILESLGGGVGVLDFDRDGRPDLWFPQGGVLASNSIEGFPGRLLRRAGSGYEDVSTAAGVSASKRYSHGCAIGDIDNDGFPDVLVTGYGGLTLWRNLGDGTFQDATIAAELLDDAWSSSAGWGDLNNDGVLDLYVAHYVDWSLDNNPSCLGEGGRPDVCPPRQFADLDDTVYFGRGDGSFENVTESCGLVPGGKGLGVLLADFDHDANTDVYVANDTTNNFLYVSDGRGHLDEVGVVSGTALDDLANANGSMGLAVTDYDNDGHADVWVSNYEDEVFALYRGLGNSSFAHVSTRAGIRALGTLFVGFGCISGDFDLDGDEDFASSNGHVIHHPRNAPVLQRPLVLENLAGQRFRRVEPPTGTYLSEAWMGRGLVTLDHNDDGLLDLLFVNTGQPAALLVNQSRTSGRAVRFRLVGTHSNRDATGARLTMSLDGNRQLTRCVYGGGSYLSQSEPILHFGVPDDARIIKIDVTWPGGNSTPLTPDDFPNHLADTRINQITEPVASSHTGATTHTLGMQE